MKQARHDSCSTPTPTPTQPNPTQPYAPPRRIASHSSPDPSSCISRCTSASEPVGCQVAKWARQLLKCRTRPKSFPRSSGEHPPASRRRPAITTQPYTFSLRLCPFHYPGFWYLGKTGTRSSKPSIGFIPPIRHLRIHWQNSKADQVRGRH